MDAVEQGERFTVTRDGRPIAELRPLGRRRFVPRAEFLGAASVPVVDPARLRADLDAALDGDLADPYER